MRIVSLLFLLALSLFASVGKVTAVNGETYVLRNDKNIALAVGNEIKQKDTIKTGNDGKVQLIFNDKTVITLGKNSDLSIQEYLFDEQKKLLYNRHLIYEQ